MNGKKFRSFPKKMHFTNANFANNRYAFFQPEFVKTKKFRTNL